MSGLHNSKVGDPPGKPGDDRSNIDSRFSLEPFGFEGPMGAGMTNGMFKEAICLIEA